MEGSSVQSQSMTLLCNAVDVARFLNSMQNLLGKGKTILEDQPHSWEVFWYSSIVQVGK